MVTADKINIVVDELEELKETAAQLDKIQKLLPVLSSDDYVRIRGQYDNLYLLSTCSDVKMGNSGFQVVNYDPMELQEIRAEHRQEMNALVELNQRMVHNLSEKLRAAHRRHSKK